MSEVQSLTLAEAQRRAADLLHSQQAEAAEQAAIEGLRLYPSDNHNLRLTLAHALLMQGRYRDGFREAELRDQRTKAPTWGLPYPEWDGPLAGRSILVWGEQGIGDEIQGARFIRQLRERGASRITFACRSENVRALSQVGADEVLSRFGEVSLARHDCWTSLWSIPYRLGMTLEDVSGESYLRAEPRGAGGVGLVERGSQLNLRDKHRSIPEGLLQAAVPEGRPLQPEGDVHDSLRLLAGLDLLITVDTSWAHMAGALGIPCWVLLPFQALDWRWMRERGDSPWYASVRLFRQPSSGDWPSVLRQVRAELDAR